MKKKDILMIGFHVAIISILLFFYFGSFLFFLLNVFPLGLFFLKGDKNV